MGTGTLILIGRADQGAFGNLGSLISHALGWDTESHRASRSRGKSFRQNLMAFAPMLCSNAALDQVEPLQSRIGRVCLLRYPLDFGVGGGIRTLGHWNHNADKNMLNVHPG